MTFELNIIVYSNSVGGQISKNVDKISDISRTIVAEATVFVQKIFSGAIVQWLKNYQDILKSLHEQLKPKNN